MTRAQRLVVATVAAVAAAGCKEELADRAALLTGPAAFVWKSDSRFEARERPAMHGTFNFYKAELSVSVEGFPPGTALELGPRRALTNDRGWASLSLDLRPRLVGLRLGDRDTQLDDKFALGIQPVGRDGFTLPLPSLTISSYQLEELLKAVENGPVTFGDEPPPVEKGPPKSLYWVNGASDKKLFGRVGRLGELDGVVISRRRPEVMGRKRCGGYKRDGKPLPDLDVLLKETEVFVYDRRTGAVVERRVFPPRDECPMFVMRRAGEDSVDSYEPWDAIAGYLRAFVQGTVRDVGVTEAK